MITTLRSVVTTEEIITKSESEALLFQLASSVLGNEILQVLENESV